MNYLFMCAFLRLKATEMKQLANSKEEFAYAKRYKLFVNKLTAHQL